MSIAPFHPTPAPVRRSRTRRATEMRRARLAMVAAVIGIAAALIAYAVSPAVRHAVGHAEHSMKHTVSNIFDHDRTKPQEPQGPAEDPSPGSQPHVRVQQLAPHRPATHPATRLASAAAEPARAGTIGACADVAQLVEHFTRNEGVRGSSPRVGFMETTAVAGISICFIGVGGCLYAAWGNPRGNRPHIPVRLAPRRDAPMTTLATAR